MGRVCIVRELVAEFDVGRVCYGPSLSWAELVMCRDVPESSETHIRIFLLMVLYITKVGYAVQLLHRD